jgi:SAM-dependent methyltransferase
VPGRRRGGELHPAVVGYCHIVNLADAWERNAGEWIAWARAPGHDGFWESTWPALRQVLPAPDGTVVDLGCGEGRLGRLLQADGYQVIGIDRSPTLARAAAAASPAWPVVLADALFVNGLAITAFHECGDRAVPWLLVLRAEKRIGSS